MRYYIIVSVLLLGLLFFFGQKLVDLVESSSEPPETKPSQRVAPPEFSAFPFDTSGRSAVIRVVRSQLIPSTQKLSTTELLDLSGQGRLQMKVAWDQDDLEYQQVVMARQELESLLTTLLANSIDLDSPAAQSERFRVELQGKNARRLAKITAAEMQALLTPLVARKKIQAITPIALAFDVTQVELATALQTWPLRRPSLEQILKNPARQIESITRIQAITKKIRGPLHLQWKSENYWIQPKAVLRVGQ